MAWGNAAEHYIPQQHAETHPGSIWQLNTISHSNMPETHPGCIWKHTEGADEGTENTFLLAQLPSAPGMGEESVCVGQWTRVVGWLDG